jgi:hypothetical protein
MRVRTWSLALEPDRYHEVVNDPTRPRAEKVLVTLYYLEGPAPASRIISTLRDAGARDVESWNVSQILRRTKGMAALVNDGWKLLQAGKQHIQSSVPAAHEANISKAALSLRDLTKRLPAGPLSEFVLETIRCVEQRTWRAAIVLSWLGAVWHLQEVIFAKHLVDFNAAATKRFAKAKPIKTMDGFAQFQEADFLQICEDIGFLGKSAKKLLGQRLDLRNAAGHPNTIQFDEEQVSAHVSFLITNAFART